ncbi:MAG: malectin domain-containing carbohydrate-binding protein [Planctomycetota bacterium]
MGIGSHKERGHEQAEREHSDGGIAEGRTSSPAFAELEHESGGKRVFDIAIQGKVVAKDLDIFQEAGGKNQAVVKEFGGIEANETIVIEFIPKIDDPAADQLPVLQGIELERERVLTLGLSAPSFLLSNTESQQEGEILVVNHKEHDFRVSRLKPWRPKISSMPESHRP